MFRLLRIVGPVLLTAWASAAAAQTTTVHLHNEASTTSGLLQLKTAGPDLATKVAIQTVDLRGQPNNSTGIIKRFDTQANIPNLKGTIPGGASVTFTIFMRKTTAFGQVFPQASLGLNATGTVALCTATGATALTTTLQAFTFSCTTPSGTSIGMTATDRWVVSAGYAMPTGPGTNTMRVELDLEGTGTGAADSRVVAPNPRPPSVTSLNPTSGAVGRSVVLTGTNFGTSGTVKFGSVVAPSTTWSGTSITAPVPTGAVVGSVSVTVTVNGAVSTGVPFTVLATPTISSLSPTSGAVGASITINGANFGSPQGTSTVTFNGTPATSVTSWVANKIVALVPAGAATGPIVVTVAGVSSAGRPFTVPLPPVINPPLVPSAGGISQTVVINGANFGASGTVKFFTTTAGIFSWSPTSITAQVPSLALGDAPVTVTVGTQVSNAVTFTVLPTPAIDSVAPNPAPVGAAVTLVGRNLGATRGASTLTFTGTPATTFTSWSATQIQTVVPAGASTGEVVVTVGGVPSQVSGFLLVRPTLTALSPPSAHLNDVVTITGVSFQTSQGFSTVRFNGTLATPTAWSDTSITVPIPVGTTSGNVVVQVFNGANVSNPLPFTVIPPPTVTGATPAGARVGDAVTVVGTNFGASQGTNTIAFNGLTTTPSAWSDTRITAPVPVGAATGPIVVTVSGASSPGFPFTVILPGALGGTITRVTGGAAISGATVQAVLTGMIRGSATTAANGSYSIASLDPGAYDVRVFASGFSGEWRHGVTVAAATTTTLDIGLSMPGSVGGRVTQADGVTPMVGASVAVYAGSLPSGTASTNTTGDYTIGGLHPGAVTVQAAHVGYTTVEQGATVAESATTMSNFTLQGAATGPVLYAYDALNRLVQVTDPSGASAIYRYDAVGNILAIERPGLTGVAISDVTPARGSIGTTVTLVGTGFSATPSQNTVTFGGTPASVTSATATQLVVTVPSGLADGSYVVGVTTPGGSATRPGFVVASTSGPPTITGFTPAIAAAGTALTVTGTNFEPVAIHNNLRINLASAPLGSVTATAIQATVPALTTTGRVSVATPSGTAVSESYVWVAPPPYATTDVESTATIAVGAPAAVSVAGTDKIALLAFEGRDGQRVSLTIADSAGPATVTLYDPLGQTIQFALGQNGFVETTLLRSRATYTVVFDPQTASATGATLTLNDVPPDVAATIVAGGPPVTVTPTVPGQNVRVTFVATAGQRVSLDQAGFNCFSAATTILRPDGTTQASTCGGTFVNVQTLPVAGTYTMLVDPKDAVTGATTLTLYDVPADLTGSIVAGGAPVTVTPTVPGQNARLTFAATAGQRVSLGQTGFNCFSATTTILRPDGTAQASACGGDYLDVQTLPVTGTYTLLLDPKDAATGATTLTLYDVPADSTGTVTIGGAAVAVPLAVPGAIGTLSVSVSAAQAATVHVTGNTCGWVAVTLLDAGGGTVATTTLPFDAFDLSAGTLGPGTYTIRIDPSGANVGSLTISVTNP